MALKLTSIPAITSNPDAVPAILQAMRDNLLAVEAAIGALNTEVAKNNQRGLANLYAAGPGSSVVGLLKLGALSDVLFIVSFTGSPQAYASPATLQLSLDGSLLPIGDITNISGTAVPTTLFTTIKGMKAGTHIVGATSTLPGVSLVAMALSA